MPRVPAFRRLPAAASCAAALFLCLLATGCATRAPVRGPDSAIRALDPLPSAPDDSSSPSDAVLAAFLSAGGLEIPPSERAALLLPGVVQGRIDRTALLRTARSRDRIVAVLPASREALWEALDRNLPLLLYLPADTTSRGPAVSLAIPVAWNRATGNLSLLDGPGPLREMPSDRFFDLRAPIGQAALCLATPRTLSRLPLPESDRTLLLADHHLALGRYRRAASLYDSLLADLPADSPAILPALSGLAATHIHRGTPDRAIPLYARALALSPDDPRLHNNLAYAMLLARADPRDAMAHAEQALAITPDNPLALETAGAIRLRLGEPEAAARLFERAWSHALHSPPETQIAIQDQLARAWLRANRPDLARQVAAHRHSAYPDYAMPSDLFDAFPDLRRSRAPHPAPSDP